MLWKHFAIYFIRFKLIFNYSRKSINIRHHIESSIKSIIIIDCLMMTTMKRTINLWLITFFHKIFQHKNYLINTFTKKKSLSSISVDRTQ